jgi:predicted membrane metal-binding protein
MGCITYVACVAGRGVSLRRAISYAYIVLLTINPYMLLYDVGFSLSFFAIIGIAVCSRLYETIDIYNSRIRSLLHTYIVPSI